MENSHKSLTGFGFIIYLQKNSKNLLFRGLILERENLIACQDLINEVEST